jgi:ABC-2 type transport system permease protein
MPIFDQGYQHWQGPLSGHARRWLVITRHGVRVHTKNRILRLLLIVAWLPALALIVAMAIWGLVEQQAEGVLRLVRNLLPADMLLDPRAYRATAWTLAYSFFFKTQMFFIMLLVVVAGPGLISRDLRFNALPLYFARPLTRLDYVLGKLGVIGALVAAVAVGPALFAYIVGVGFSLDISVVGDTFPVLLGSLAFGLVITLSVGTLILALSSLSKRSLYVGIAFAGLWIISGSVGSAMTVIYRESVRRQLYDTELTAWVEENPPPPGVQMRGVQPVVRFQSKLRKLRPHGVPPGQEQEADQWYDAWSKASQLARAKSFTGLGDALRDDWRPLCSYVANLDRIGDQLLDTDTAWVTIGKAVELPRAAFQGAIGPPGRPRIAPGVNNRRLADQLVAQYPWQWSAGVLTALLGFSLWILRRRVKSLDQLR